VLCAARQTAAFDGPRSALNGQDLKARDNAMTATGIDYTQVCFVIMPFGKKKVGDQEVDFDFIYREVFEPAIARTPIGSGGAFLVPKRTDQDFSRSRTDRNATRPA
jgi:hypothetical protein